jgi:hypothetical protein
LEKALKAGQNKQYREDWLGNSWGTANKSNVGFSLDQFFIIPQEYLDMRESRNEQIQKIQEEINDLQVQLDTLEVRIMLTSDANLKTLINEIDDMGDIKLIDTKIKLLN